MSDGYESADDVAEILRQAQAVSDQAAAAKVSPLRAMAIKLGIIRGSPLEVPLLSKSDAMEIQLQRSFGTPQPVRRMPQQIPAWVRSYAQPQMPSNSLGGPWDAISAEAQKEQKIADELGGFSKSMLASPLVTGQLLR